MAKKIVVTGASGVLGMAVVLEARARGLEVTGLYHSTPIAIPGVRTLALDLTNEIAVSNFFASAKPDLTVHAAAEVRVDWCEDHPQETARVNVDAAALVADAAARVGAKLLHVSTDSVFDGGGQDYKESSPTNPVNVYASSKVRAEGEVTRLCPAAVIVRTNFYGWGGRRKLGLIDWILQELSNDRAVPGFADVVFCPLLVNDVAIALLDLLTFDVAGIFHVVGREAVSKYEFARRVAETFGFSPELVRKSSIDEASLRAPRPKNTLLDVSKVTVLLGREMPDVSAGLRHYAELRAGGYQSMLDAYFKE